MIRYLFSMMLVLLFLGCQASQPSQQTENPVPANPTIPSFRLFVDNEELAIGETTHHMNAQATSELVAPASYYGYVFQRQGGKITSCVFTPEQSGRKKFVKDLETQKSFDQDTDWFVVVSPRSLDMGKLQEKVASFAIAPGKASEGNLYPKPMHWRLYSLKLSADGREIEHGSLLTQAEIGRGPLALAIHVQRKGEEKFREFLLGKENIGDGDRLKLKLQAYQPTYVAIFLCDRPEKVHLLFPEDKNATVPLQPDSLVSIPSSAQGISMDATNGRALYVFPSSQPIDYADLERKLKHVDMLPRLAEGTGSVEEEENLPTYFKLELEKY